MEYNIWEPWKTLDPWQKEYIASEGNNFLLCGRQSGKTTAASIKFGNRAAKKENQVILMLAYTEKQAYNLFFKTLMYIRAKYPKMIKKGKEAPTKHIINLTNGSVIMCYAAGLTGEGIRTFTVTSLVIDEAAPMAREVFIATTPMLSVTKGTLDILSTPRGKEGYFYECSDDPELGDKIRDDFTRFYVSAEDCPRHTKEFLLAEKASMTLLEYAQEYQARFLDEVKQFFPDELIKSCFTPMNYSVFKRRIPSVSRFLGVDIARMGGDETVLISLDRYDKEYLNMVEMIVTKNTMLTDTVRLILEKDLANKYKKIYIDDGGLGVGVLDPLLEHPQTRKKIVGINNAKRYYEHKWEKGKEKGGKSTLMKEEGYINLKILMENGKIKLQKSQKLFQSLKSIQAEDINGKFKIWGRDAHAVEALWRAAYSIKDKALDPFIF